MTQIKTRPTRGVLLAVSGLLAIAATVGSQVEASELRLGRYQTVLLLPSNEQIDPMSSIIEIELPAEINTLDIGR